MFKKIVFLAVISLSLFVFSCKQGSKSKLQVTCTFKNADKLLSPNSRVYLEEVGAGKDQQPLALDSTKLTSNDGSVTLTAKTKDTDQQIFELVFGDNVLAIPIINDAAQMHVDVDLSKKDNF